MRPLSCCEEFTLPVKAESPKGPGEKKKDSRGERKKGVPSADVRNIPPRVGNFHDGKAPQGGNRGGIGGKGEKLRGEGLPRNTKGAFYFGKGLVSVSRREKWKGPEEREREE